MKEMIPVNIVIAERTYRLKIEPADEESLRKTVKLINDKVSEFRNNFAGKDMQDYVAMVLLWFATEQGKAPVGEIALHETAASLAALEQQVDRVLAEMKPAADSHL